MPWLPVCRLSRVTWQSNTNSCYIGMKHEIRNGNPISHECKMHFPFIKIVLILGIPIKNTIHIKKITNRNTLPRNQKNTEKSSKMNAFKNLNPKSSKSATRSKVLDLDARFFLPWDARTKYLHDFSGKKKSNGNVFSHSSKFTSI